MRLSIGYSDSEDRLWIRSEATNTLWWVSRRLALRLIGHWAQLLERSLKDDEPQARDEAGGDEDEGARAARRRRALREEHERAVAVTRERKVEPVGRPPPGVELENCLMATAELSAGARGVRILLKAPGRTETLTMSRDEAHRMLHGLFRRCARVGWYASRPPEWLAAELPDRPRAAPGTAEP